MEKAALALALLVSSALLLTELPAVSAQVLCRSQFSLANEACSLRSFVPGARRPGPGLPRPRQLQLNETSVTTTSAAAAAGSHGGDQAALKSSRDDSDDDDDDYDGDSGSRRSSSRHHHRHYSEDEDPHDTACCRRIMGLDNSCVCQATARLPPFMNSVRHAIKLTPIEGCEVTFECPGPLF